jgi:hypothetical protein
MGTRLRTEETYVTPPMPAPATWPRASVPEYGPRVVRLRRATQVAMGLMGTLAAGIALFGGLLVTQQAQQGTALMREGKVISGVVTNKTKNSDGKKYRLTYRYQMGNEVVERTKNVRRAFYDAHGKDKPIEITALPRKPSVHELGRVTKGDVDKDLAKGAILVVTMVGLFGGLAALIRGAAQREMRILSDWTATSAQIIARKKTYAGQNGAATYKLRIRYRVPRQADLETDVKLSRPGKWDAEPGTFLDIFYNPEDVTQVRVRDGLTSAEIDPATY